MRSDGAGLNSCRGVASLTEFATIIHTRTNRAGAGALHLFSSDTTLRESHKTHALVLLVRPCPTAALGFTLVDVQVQSHSKAIAHVKASINGEIFSSKQYFCLISSAPPGDFNFKVVFVEDNGGRFPYALTTTGSITIRDWRKASDAEL